MLGAVYGTAYTLGYFDEDSVMKIVYQDGSTAFGDRFTGMTLEEALAKCDEVAASDESIAYAFPEGSYLDAQENMSGTIDLIPIVHYGTGDLNANGEADLSDALLLARATSSMHTLSVAARAEADLNADGEVNQTDLTLLLQKLAGL